MEELKKKISNRVRYFVDIVFDEADEAEAEERYLNKSKVGKGLNELYNGLDLDFIDAKERMVKSKRGWGR